MFLEGDVVWFYISSRFPHRNFNGTSKELPRIMWSWTQQQWRKISIEFILFFYNYSFLSSESTENWDLLLCTIQLLKNYWKVWNSSIFFLFFHMLILFLPSNGFVALSLSLIDFDLRFYIKTPCSLKEWNGYVQLISTPKSIDIWVQLCLYTNALLYW